MKSKKFLLLAEQVFGSHPAYRVDLGTDRHFNPDIFHTFLDRVTGQMPGARCRMAVVGKSFEGRQIRMITIGDGPVSVMLWSQMHGDEPTATAAIADILHYFNSHPDDEQVTTMLSVFTIHFLPMLNPDGAARRKRRNAQNIDINRDAVALQTPEGVLLKKIQQSLKPAFGFNLHDQELSTTGSSRDLTAIALLAPAYDEKKSDNETRGKAKLLASAFAESMNLFVKGRVARYDDGFEPRAFGDNFQLWGTSTLLVESGHAKSDPQKETIRRINAAGILSSLYAIATGEYLQSDPMVYNSLPFNSKRAYDCIVRNVTVGAETGTTIHADLGISSQVDTHSEPPPRLVDIGDLSTFTGWEELDGTGTVVTQSNLRIGDPIDLSTLHRSQK